MSTLEETSILLSARSTLWQKFLGATLQQSAIAYLEGASTPNHANRFELACRVLLDKQYWDIAERFYVIGMCYQSIAEAGESATDAMVTQVVSERFDALANRVGGSA